MFFDVYVLKEKFVSCELCYDGELLVRDMYPTHFFLATY